ncbi:MAG: alpha/beta hydrolase [Planctomycetes bacterium]|nr:alpha/beta hydrolase [Planctomycetota bacterium]
MRTASLLLIVAAAGCASPYPYEAFPPRISPSLGELRERCAAVEFFYATDRRMTESQAPLLRFGIERDKRVKLGRGEVTIPLDHGRGRLETPGALERAAPNRHVLLARLDGPSLSTRRFWADLRSTVALSKQREVFVFIHGYFTDFASAARRAAQIAHDVEFDGPCVVYSWPSQAFFWGYAADLQNVQWTEPYLLRFLERMVRDSGAERIHIMAHSMGGQALVRAVRELVRARGDRREPEFDQIILAASDMDVELFARDYAATLTQASRRVTIYMSDNDWALLGSQRLHGYKRLGQYWSTEDIEDAGQASLDRIDLVDVTAHDKGLFGHIYYGESPRVLDDIAGVLRGKNAVQRGLRNANNHYVLDANIARRIPTSAPAVGIAP